MLVPGSRQPQFTVRLFRPFGGPNAGMHLDTITFDGLDVSFRFRTEVPGGFGTAQIGGEVRRDNEVIQAWLPVAATELVPFAHVEISDGTRSVWEGQAISAELDHLGYPVGFTAQGYWGALNNAEFQSSDASTTTSGAIIRQVVSQIVPFLRVGSGDQVQSPQVEHAAADFDGLTGGQIWDAIIREGDGIGNALNLMIWDHRTIWIQRRTRPNRPHYRASLGMPGLDISELPWDDRWGRVRTRYEDANGDSQLTDWVEDPVFVHRFGRMRSKTLNGGRLTGTAALQIAHTFLSLHTDRQYSATLTLGNNEGLPTTDGSVQPPWLIRAGQWVEIADLDWFVIRQTEYDSASQSVRLQMGEQRRDWNYILQRLRETTEALRAGINPTTGGLA